MDFSIQMKNLKKSNISVYIDATYLFMTAPRWKPKSRPYNGDTIIAKSSGSNIKLACPAYGYPKPTTTWYKEDVLFDASQRPKVRLTIDYITFRKSPLDEEKEMTLFGGVSWSCSRRELRKALHLMKHLIKKL